MDEEVLSDAAYRGTMRAFAMLCFLSALAYLPFALFLFLAVGSILAFVGPIILFAVGWVLRYISRLPRVQDHPPAGPGSAPADDSGGPAPPPESPPVGIEGVTPSQPQILWDRAPP